MLVRFRTTTILVLLIVSLQLLAVVALSQVSDDRKTPASLPLAAVNGPQKTIVILTKFSDKSNSTKPSQISNTLNDLNDYHNENSYGAVSFQTDITPSPTSPWYLMPNAMTYYGADSSSSDNQLVQDALQAAYNAGVNLVNYKFALVVHSGDDEAITHVTSDIHSYTIPGFIFSPTPLISYKISTSVVAETDPKGVYAHESGHLLGLPDLYDTTGRIDPANNFIGYWELMALGEWNPNNGNPLLQPGTYPAHMSAWSKIQLGLVPSSRVATVQSGDSANLTIQNLEQGTNSIQAVKLPVAYNPDGSMTYYLVEMRAKIGTYDQHLPFPSTYPNSGLLIYKVNESIPNGNGSVQLIDAHPGGDLNDAPFGPCGAPCVSNNTYWDQANFVKIIVTTTTATAYTITVDRTSSPLLLLQVNTPATGVLVSVDGVNLTSDASKQLRLPVRFGPHAIFVQPRIPISIGSTTVQVGLTNAFVAWDDGATTNPHGISISKDTVLTAIYRITVEPSFSAAATAAIILAIVVFAMAVHRRRGHPPPALQQVVPQAQPSGPPQPVQTGTEGSLPRNDGPSGGAVKRDEKTEDSQT